MTSRPEAKKYLHDGLVVLPTVKAVFDLADQHRKDDACAT